ncbi:glutathione ABC transporter permease [Alkalispirochaeta odontotermitis]|nr:glutathione ABC transporter permease [Alkalispirochaeta odontotermitis]CAB1081293.1 Dipeptide ABC transporter, permease protein DppB (TC 3.A.1.5.2) [Olavius algarvensis Delta 1 endosymbiont]
MLQYIIRRLLLAIPILIAVVTLVFFVVRMAPGDPAQVILGDSASEESLTALRTELGLDRPLLVQYGEFLFSIAKGDLGDSIIRKQSINSMIAEVLPYTIELTLAGVLLGVILGIPLGVFSAVFRNSAADYGVRIMSLLGLSFPAFYSGILLLLAFAVYLGWFPVISDPDMGNIGERLYMLVLPAMNLGLIMMAYVVRSSRSSLLETLGEDYIRTAKAKGLPGFIILYKHALKNALIPVITIVGLYLGVLVGNSVLTEIVFNRPGLGKLILSALDERDYSLLQGLMVIYAFIIVLVNLVTDLTYGMVDPRIRKQ